MRQVLLGDDPPVSITKRAAGVLAEVRGGSADVVHPGGTVISRGPDVRWWTWAGFKTNATLTATLADLVVPAQRFTDEYVRLRDDLSPQMWRQATAGAADRICLPEVDEAALKGLKFSAALPGRLATATLAARLADIDHAIGVLGEPTRIGT